MKDFYAKIGPYILLYEVIKIIEKGDKNIYADWKDYKCSLKKVINENNVPTFLNTIVFMIDRGKELLDGLEKLGYTEDEILDEGKAENPTGVRVYYYLDEGKFWAVHHEREKLMKFKYLPATNDDEAKLLGEVL